MFVKDDKNPALDLKSPLPPLRLFPMNPPRPNSEPFGYRAPGKCICCQHPRNDAKSERYGGAVGLGATLSRLGSAMGERNHLSRVPTPPSPPHPLDRRAWTHLLALMRLGDATLRDDFDSVGYTGLGVSGFIAASEAPLERRGCIICLGAPEWPGRARRAPPPPRSTPPQSPNTPCPASGPWCRYGRCEGR